VKRLRIGIVSLVCIYAALALPVAANAATPGNISGKVTSASTGSPIAFLDVCAYTATTHEYGGCDYTDFEGEYLIENLAAGSYKVEFRAEPYEEAGEYLTQWYNGKPSFEAANSVAVTEGETTTGINASMQERGGKVSGTVTDATNGATIDGIEVCASPTSTSEYYFYFGYYCTKTSGGGQYTLSHVEAGSYRIEFRSPYKYNEALETSELEGPNYVTQYYNGQGKPESANAVNVSDGQTTGNINAAMQPGATISGTVTDALTGAALQGISVCAWGSTEYQCSQTDTNGQYAIATLSAGVYKAEFTPEYFFNKAAYKEGKRVWLRTELPLIEYARQFYNEKVTFETADPITATAGATTSNINAKMVKQTQPPVQPGKGVVGAKAKVKGGKALLHIKCIGAGPCKGVVKLTAPAVTKKKKAKKRNMVIGKAPFGILPGNSKVVRVKLSGKGMALLRTSGKKGLKVKASGKGVQPGTVVLKGGAKKKHGKH
jgi:Carboxypeptidase regulatory-like domain